MQRISQYAAQLIRVALWRHQEVMGDGELQAGGGGDAAPAAELPSAVIVK